MEFIDFLRAQWDRAAAVAFTALGLITLLLGWIGVSGVKLIVKQIPYIVSGGMAGIVFVSIGAVLWVSADMRDQWRELRYLRTALDRLENQDDQAEVHPTTGDNGQSSVDNTAEILLATRSVKSAARAQARPAARTRSRAKPSSTDT